MRRRLTLLTMLVSFVPATVAAQTESVEYYGTDAIGSVRVVFDASGNILTRQDYGPFGVELTNVSGLPPERFGQLTRDGEAALDYAQARTYQWRTGRFSKPDLVFSALVRPQSWNRYTYALNNPLGYNDADGRDPLPVFRSGVEQDMPLDPAFHASASGINIFKGDIGAVFQVDFGPSFYAGGGGASTGQTPTPPPPPPPPPGPDPITPPPPPVEEPDATKLCSGRSRVLRGNPDTIGRPGGFSGETVGEIPVTAEGAAIILSQWGMTKPQIRPYLGQISGTFPEVDTAFHGVVDTVGGRPPRGAREVRSGLMQRNPNVLIIELPGAARDYGVTHVNVTVPSSVACPAGTSAVR